MLRRQGQCHRRTGKDVEAREAENTYGYNPENQVMILESLSRRGIFSIDENGEGKMKKGTGE